MKTAEVIELFGGARNVARLLGISHQAVYKWGEVLPVRQERAVRKVIREFLAKAGPAR